MSLSVPNEISENKTLTCNIPLVRPNSLAIFNMPKCNFPINSFFVGSKKPFLGKERKKKKKLPKYKCAAKNFYVFRLSQIFQ